MQPHPSSCPRFRLAVLTGLVAAASLARAEAPDFQTWLAQVRQEASARGISAATLERTFSGMTPIEKVIELDRRQPEFTETFLNYLDKRVSAQRIDAGQQLLAEHGALLERLEQRYGVPATVLVSFWGLETNYGSHLGGFSTPAALATLAHEGRRGAFFRRELLDALAILDAGHVSPEAMHGSWAGAMGQMQFMPSTFQRHAIDEDGDGRKDLWASIPDALASAANFLHAIGWRDGEVWGREVRLPDNLDLDMASATNRSGRQWASLGVTQADGTPLPDPEMLGNLILPQGRWGPAFIVHRNFYVVMDWNNSLHYALAVNHLADRLAGLPRLSLGRDADNRPMRREQALELQKRLTHLGFDPGVADGIIGGQTRAAVRAYQRKQGMPADGYASLGVLERLQADTADLVLSEEGRPTLPADNLAAGRS